MVSPGYNSIVEFVLKQLGLNEFSGPAGAVFTIAIETDRGILAGVEARYNGETRGGPRLAFRIAARHRYLVTTFVASDPAAVITISEVKGNARRLLARRSAHDSTVALRITPE